VAEAFDYAVVLALGGLVGAAELVARYRDAPARAIRSQPALFYVTVNAAAAAAALGLVRAFDWQFGMEGAEEVRWTQVLVAGFGAMALFRSSLFVVRAGDQDVAVGPQSVLQIILTAADRSVDRLRGGARARRVASIMQGVSYDLAKDALPVLCLALMQNVPAEEQKALGLSLGALEQNTNIGPAAKILPLGLALMNVVGEDVLAGAVDTLRPQITTNDSQ